LIKIKNYFSCFVYNHLLLQVNAKSNLTTYSKKCIFTRNKHMDKIDRFIVHSFMIRFLNEYLYWKVNIKSCVLICETFILNVNILESSMLLYKPMNRWIFIWNTLYQFISCVLYTYDNITSVNSNIYIGIYSIHNIIEVYLLNLKTAVGYFTVFFLYISRVDCESNYYFVHTFITVEVRNTIIVLWKLR